MLSVCWQARMETAVIWNSQTATILEEDLTRMAALKEMGFASMILAYNDRFRTGSGSLAAYDGKDDGLTTWGRSVIDEMTKYGIILDLSHTGNKMRVYQQVWEGAPEGKWDKEYAERVKLRNELLEKYGPR